MKCQEKPLLIPVTGAFNPSLRLFMPRGARLRRAMLNPIGEAHFQRITHEAKAVGFVVERPIVLENFGLNHPEQTDDQVRQQVHKRLQRHPERSTILVGHSLGGSVLTAIAADMVRDGQVTGAITLGSPHDGAHELLMFLARAAKYLPGHNGLTEENLAHYNQYAKQAAKTAIYEYGLDMTFVGSPDDRLVPLGSAITPHVGARLEVVGRITDNDRGIQGACIHEFGKQIGHIGLLTSHESALLVADLAVEMTGIEHKAITSR